MADKWAQYAEPAGATDKWAQFVEQPTQQAVQTQQLPQNPIPPAYGFTPGHMLNQAVQGVTQLGQGIYSLGKDLINNPNWVTGPNSTAQKFIFGPAEQMRQKAQTAQTPSESLGYSAAEAIPMLGPWAAGLGEQAGTGDVGGALARGGAQAAVPAALTSPILRGAVKGGVKGGVEGLLQTKIAGGVLKGAIKGANAARVAGAEPIPAATEVPKTGISQENLNAIRSGGEATRRSSAQFVQDVIRGKGLPAATSELANLEAAQKGRAAEMAQKYPVQPLERTDPFAQQMEQQLAAPAAQGPYKSASAPKMEAVDSTNIGKVGHNGKDMWIEYKNGNVYQYKNVPEEVFNKAKNSESVGSYVNRNIRGKYATSLKGAVPVL